MDYKGYVIRQADSAGGKAGRGHNKTSTIQVREPMPDGYLLKKSFRWRVADRNSLNKAIEKAKKYVDDSLSKPTKQKD